MLLKHGNFAPYYNVEPCLVQVLNQNFYHLLVTRHNQFNHNAHNAKQKVRTLAAFYNIFETLMLLKHGNFAPYYNVEPCLMQVLNQNVYHLLVTRHNQCNMSYI